MTDSHSSTHASSAQAGSRRSFIAGAFALAAVPVTTSTLGVRALAASDIRMNPLPRIPGLGEFERLIGTAFAAAAGTDQTAIQLTLKKATAHAQHQPGVAEKFALLFTLSEEHAFESRIYELRHPAIGSVQLFISPVGDAGLQGGARAEAIISLAPVAA